MTTLDEKPLPLHIQWKAVSMKSCFDEKSLWWKAALMRSCFDEKPLWWKAALMKSRLTHLTIMTINEKLKCLKSFHNFFFPFECLTAICGWMLQVLAESLNGRRKSIVLMQSHLHGATTISIMTLSVMTLGVTMPKTCHPSMETLRCIDVWLIVVLCLVCRVLLRRMSFCW